MLDNISNREGIEWGNTWWEEANNPNVDRIALLGDSVTRGIRGKLNDLFLKDNCVVDCCCSSSQITDELTEKQIRFFFEAVGFDYKLVIFQWVNQHGLNMFSLSDKLQYEKYIMSVDHIVDVIFEYCNNIVFLSPTPAVLKDNLTVSDTERNNKIMGRADILKNVADKYHIKYIDIFDICMPPQIVHTDYVHFDNDSYKYIAYKIYSELLEIK